MKIRTMIFAVLTLLWCAVIFGFSSENGEESGSTSEKIVITVCETVVPDFEEMPQMQRDLLVDRLQFFVRKTAHFTEYCILGILCWQSLCMVNKKRLREVFSVLFCFLYACTDELHQHFVPGRGPSPRDVVIDTGGALMGVLISVGAASVIAHIRRRKRA